MQLQKHVIVMIINGKQRMKTSELIIIIFGFSFMFFCSGILVGQIYERKKINNYLIDHLETEQLVIEDNKCQPYFPDFPNNQGMVIYPETGLMIIDFPDNMKIIIEQEGVQ